MHVDQARKALNKARERLAEEPAIWITAAKLEEPAREAWLKEAEAAERVRSVLTYQAIVLEEQYWHWC